MYIIYAILAFSLLIIVHELGHFIVAKINGVRVTEFSIGMGPKILSIKGKETYYSIGILPIGGYVDIYGQGEEINEEDSFSTKSPFQKLSIILAGAFMNVVLALVLFSAVLYNFGYGLPVVESLVPKSAAEEAGIMPGDRFVEINGSKIYSKDDMTLGISMSKTKSISLKVDRNGEILSYNITPKYNEEMKRDLLGFNYKFVENPSIKDVLKESVNETITLFKQTYIGFKNLITGNANLKTDVGGPVTIIRLTGQAARNGIWNLLYFTAFMSINLAVVNMLPLPALDGGWALVYLIEIITRKKVPEKAIQVIGTVGMILLMGIMLLVTVKDILFPVSF